MKRKIILSILILIWLSLLAVLFTQKEKNKARLDFKNEIRKEILGYMELEETFPPKLEDLKDVDLTQYHLKYEIIADGTGCRITVDEKEVIELWLEGN